MNLRDDLKVHGSNQANVIHLLATSSHDDAIDTLNNGDQNNLLALYVFAAPPVAKYLTQFVRSNVSFVNHIPANLLGESPNIVSKQLRTLLTHYSWSCRSDGLYCISDRKIPPAYDGNSKWEVRD
jgi:hypothetical protein